MAFSSVASMTTIAVVFLFFDGMSFPISAGLFFLVAGLCGAIRVIAAADVRLFALRRAPGPGQMALHEPLTPTAARAVESADHVGTTS